MATEAANAAEAAMERAERPLGARQILAFFGMSLGMFLAVLNIQIVGSSFDQIQAGLAAGRDEVSWVLTSALIAEVIITVTFRLPDFPTWAQAANA